MSTVWEASFARLAIAVLMCGLALMAPRAMAEDVAAADAMASTSEYEIGKDYALGLQRFAVDSHTEILGWKMSQTVYFGRQDGLDSGLTIVWQPKERLQYSLSKDGLRFTTRF